MPLRSFLLSFIVSLCFISSNAQQIVYSQPDNDDPREVSFDIIGKMNGQYLVYKTYGGHYKICVYDNDMKLVTKTDIPLVPERLINTDFVVYKDFCYFIYQYQKKDVVYCMASKIDANGQVVGKPLQLDTTAINFLTDNKIYNVICSEDKQKIDVFKINSKDVSNYGLTNILFDASLNLISKTRSNITMPGRNDFLDNFEVDNDGCIVFVRAQSVAQNDNINQLTLVTKKTFDSTVAYHPLPLSNFYLDNITIKIDNKNKHYLIASLYNKSRRGNVDGLYTNLWSRDGDSSKAQRYVTFSDDLRTEAKGQGQSQRSAFDDYYIQNIIMDNDGGFLIASESVTSTSRGNPMNRWDYYNSPYMSPGAYYANPYALNYSYYPWSYPYLGATNPYQMLRYYAENIVVLSFDSSITTQWSNVVYKSQYDDNTDNFLGYTILNTGSDLHFVFNKMERRANLLSDQIITPDGQLHTTPTMHNLDNNYTFMPKRAKQVGSHQLLIPCAYRSYICFAKVDL